MSHAAFAVLCFFVGALLCYSHVNIWGVFVFLLIGIVALELGYFAALLAR
jgi:hypothetical protein